MDVTVKKKIIFFTWYKALLLVMKFLQYSKSVLAWSDGQPKVIQSFRKALFQKSLTFSFSSRQAIFCNKERVCAKEQVLVPALFDDEAFPSQAFLVFLYQFFAKVRFWSIFKCTSITKCLCVRTRATDLFATLADLGLHRLLVFGGLLRVTHGRIEE